MNREAFIDDLSRSLDTLARDEFGHVERFVLRAAMEACGMEQYPAVAGDPGGERAGHNCICDQCHVPYYRHPLDWRVIGYGNRPFLHVLCDGHRVKL